MQRLKKAALLATCIILWVPRTKGLMGYDCSGSSLNITTYSLLDITDCKLSNSVSNYTEVNIELIQLNKYEHVIVDECRIEIDRRIFYCGMHSHISTVQNSRKKYLLDLDHKDCQRLHETGSLTLSSRAEMVGLVKNITNRRTVMLAGRTALDGSCKGTQYSEAATTWEDVVVEAVVEIYYTTYSASVDINNNKVILKSSAKCDFSLGKCMDSLGTQAYWSIFPNGNCAFEKYTTLYRGSATKWSATDVDPELYIVSTAEYAFSLEKRSNTKYCGYLLIQTELPKLYILEAGPGNSFPTNKVIDVENIDLIQYVNAKIIHTERHIRTQMTQLYHRIRFDQCEAQRTNLKNSLSLALVSPDVFAYQIMKGPGYHALVTGETVSIIKCTAVPLQFRKTEECHLELPVNYNNQSYFLTGLSRMLVRRGTIVDCNGAIPTTFFLDNQWFTMNPNWAKTPAPLTFKPSAPIEWHYDKIENLGSSGLYSDTDMEKLRDRLLTRTETVAVMSNIARAALGNEIPEGSLSLRHLLDREALEEITTSVANKVWGGFMNFGSASAGIFGIFIIIQFIKSVINTLIYGYTLYDIYGFSIHLLGAIWVSITHLLVHLSNRSKDQNTEESMIGIPMKSYRKPAIESSQGASMENMVHGSTQTVGSGIDKDLITQARKTLNSS